MGGGRGSSALLHQHTDCMHAITPKAEVGYRYMLCCFQGGVECVGLGGNGAARSFRSFYGWAPNALRLGGMLVTLPTWWAWAAAGIDPLTLSTPASSCMP